MLLENSFGLKGLFKCVVRNTDESVKYETDWIPNLITNKGLDFFCSTSSNFSTYLHIGTGTTAPAITDTTLANRVTSTSITVTPPAATDNLSVSPYYKAGRVGKRFNAGTLNGNYTELGFGNDTGSTIYTRALFKDNGGNPIAITVLPTEILDIYYEMRLYATSETDTVLNNVVLTGAGTTHTITIRNAMSWCNSLVPSGVRNLGGVGYTWDLPLPSITSAYSSTGRTSMSSVASPTYIPGTYYREHTVKVGVGSNLNIQLILGTESTSSGQLYVGTHYHFSPTIVKTDSQEFTFTFRHNFGRM